MSKQEIMEKVDRLMSVPKCKDINYKRNPTDKELVKEITEDQKGFCWLCKCKTTVPVCHHIIPDGESTKENLVMICSNCHKWVHWMLKKYFGWRASMDFYKTYM